MDKDAVKHLAELARLHMDEIETEQIASDLGAIISYVEEVKKISGKAEANIGVPVKNVMRPDSNPNETGKFTDKVLRSAPSTEGSYIKVKKIL